MVKCPTGNDIPAFMERCREIKRDEGGITLGPFSVGKFPISLFVILKNSFGTKSSFSHGLNQLPQIWNIFRIKNFHSKKKRLKGSDFLEKRRIDAGKKNRRWKGCCTIKSNCSDRILDGPMHSSVSFYIYKYTYKYAPCLLIINGKYNFRYIFHAFYRYI